MPTTPDGGSSSEGNGDGDAANDVFNWFSCCTSPVIRCPSHTPHPSHRAQHALTAPAVHPNRRLSRCQAAASCCQAVGASVGATWQCCNLQLATASSVCRRRATGDGRQATGDGLFSLPLWHWQLTARAACNLFDLPLLAKQPQFCNSLTPQLCLSPSLCLPLSLP